MRRNQKKTSAGGAMVLLTVLLNGIVLEQAATSNRDLYSLLLFTIPLLVISIIASQAKAV
jgi:hypothetical protein